MIVRFASGGILYSSDMQDWGKEDLLAFAKVIENWGTSVDLRFCSVIDGEASFVYVKTAQIDFIQFSQDEYTLMQLALNPPKKESGVDQPAPAVSH